MKATPAMINQSLSHYKITAELGRGGMGIVYRATDTKLNRDVAIKVLPAAALASEEDRARFFREAQGLAQVADSGVPQVHNVGQAGPRGAARGRSRRRGFPPPALRGPAAG